ncbi:hypothetical protein NUSPORA_01230 [Nucleospora cyclopteri]
MKFIQQLKKLNISDAKIEELQKKPAHIKNLEMIQQAGNEITRMQYTLACTSPKDTDIIGISNTIAKGLVKHDAIIKGLMQLKNKTEKDYEEFCLKHNYSDQEIIDYTETLKKEKRTKLEIRKSVRKKFPFCDLRICFANLADYGIELPLKKYVKSWLDEGEISFLHKPEENKQVSEKMLEEHLKRTKGKVVTRFPPEPNGNLHIGHAKALNVSFEYAKKHGGYTYLRYDDTNPRNEAEEHYDHILEDVKWLGFEPYKITASSDHFELMHEMCRKLINKNSAYICFCSNEEMKNRRFLYQAEREIGNEDATILSPYRNTSKERNLKLFDKMINGEFRDGEACLRFRMPLESKNPLMLDLVGARVIDMVHEKKKKNYIVYPSYEFALCVCDSLEDVTHSFCSREFYTRQEPYHWLLKELELYEPVQWEFSRLNLSNTVLSKRKLTKIVQMGLNWDDPRFYTIRGMRRRGFPPAAINKFVQSVGITYSDNTAVDLKILESFVSKELFETAGKISAIINPLKVYIDRKKRGKIGETEVEISKFLFIDSSDFSAEAEEGFLRLTPENPVGLISLGVLKYVGKESDGIRCQLLDFGEIKTSKFIQWLPHLNNKVELRMYKPLFNSFRPEEVNYLEDINIKDSLEVVDGFCDDHILNIEVEDKFQFIRIGYFCCDPDSVLTAKEKKIVLNLTLELKSGYNKAKIN